MQMVAQLNALGFRHDAAQAARAERKEGQFKGWPNMSSIDPELEVLYHIGNAAVRDTRFRTSMCPTSSRRLYPALLANLPPQDSLKTLSNSAASPASSTRSAACCRSRADHRRSRAAPARVLGAAGGWLLGRRFGDTMIGKFAPYLVQRFGDLRSLRFDQEGLIVRDRTDLRSAAYRHAEQGAVVPFLPAGGRLEGPPRHLDLRAGRAGLRLQRRAALPSTSSSACAPCRTCRTRCSRS